MIRIQKLIMMFAILVGCMQLKAAASSSDVSVYTQARMVTTYGVLHSILPREIAELNICYLRNSPFDRLVLHPARVEPRILGLFEKIVQEPYVSYRSAYDPISPSEILTVTVGQILNANPFIPSTAVQWLYFCCKRVGIRELVDRECSSGDQSVLLNQAITFQLLHAAVQNERNRETACKYLEYPGKRRYKEIDQFFENIEKMAQEDATECRQ